MNDITEDHMSEREVNAAWLKAEIEALGTQPFVMFSNQCCVTRETILEEVRPRLPHGAEGVAMLITTIEAIDDFGIVLAPRHRQDFLDGYYVYIVPQMVGHLNERPQGRQRVLLREAVARDGLYANVALSTERIRGLDEGQTRNRRSVDQRRTEIYETIAKDVGLDRFEGQPDREKRVESFIQNAFREGQKLLKQWYPGRRARDVMAEAFRIALGGRRGDRRQFEVEKQAEIDRLKNLSWLHRRAQRYDQAQHGISESHREGLEHSRADIQELVNGFEGGPDIAQLMDAAIHGDVNPALLAANWASFSTELAVGRALGRLERGHTVRFEPMHLVRFERMMEQAGAATDDGNVELKAYRLVQQAALRTFGAEVWQARFAEFRASGEGIEVAPPENL
ncbi:MAG: hypothetical protein CML24_03235 [Rhizobiales bacterium]|nr:hypothetical protein [Hyphomicrobiales bacterium]